MKTKNILMILAASLAVMAVSAPVANADKKEKAPKAEKKAAPKKTIRVLYWNIQNGMWDGQVDNYDRFVDWVNKQNPDICIWCEASTIFYTGTNQSMPKEERYLPDHWGELAERYGHTYWFKSGQRDNYPQVVTSRYPIDSLWTSVGEKPDSVVVHGAGWCRVTVDGVAQPFNIVTLHPKPFAYGYNVPKAKQAEDAANAGGEKHRRKEVEYICNHTVRTVASPETQYWIMAGDYNSRSRKDNFKYGWLDSSLSFLVHDYINSDKTPYYDLVAEVYPGIFMPSCGKSTRIDYFYVTKPLLEACKDVNATPDAYTNRWCDTPQISNFWHPSDHFPIIVDFNISKLK